MRNDNIAEEYLKYNLDISFRHIEKNELTMSKFPLLLSMINFKQALLPFLENSKFISKDFNRSYRGNENVLYCNNWDIFKYDNNDLDIAIINRGDCITLFALVPILDSTEKKEDRFIEKFTSMERKGLISWEDLYNQNKRFTNLSFEEFCTEIKELYNYDFIVLNISKKPDFYKSSYQLTKDATDFITNSSENSSKEEILEKFKNVINDIKKLDNESFDIFEYDHELELYENIVNRFISSIIKEINEPYNRILSLATNEYTYKDIKYSEHFEITEMINTSKMFDEKGLYEYWYRDLFDLKVALSY